MTYLILVISAIIFVELFILLKILKEANSVIALSMGSLNTIKSKDLSDREKEQLMRKNSVVMIQTTFKFILKFLLLFASIYLFIMVVIYFFPHLEDSIYEGFTSIVSILVVTLVASIYVWGRNVISSKL